jgi:SAM-dependent methyltransferase
MVAEVPWYDDDAFWQALAPFMYAPDLNKRIPIEVDGVIEMLPMSPPAKILDLGCGMGLHALELTRRGYQVTGLDRTALYLDAARESARKEHLNVEFVLGDMIEFKRSDAFDFVICVDTSGLSYSPDPETDRRIVGNVLTSLRPGGKFLIQTKGKEVLARVFERRSWLEQDGVFFLVERHTDEAWSWMKNRWIFIQDGNVREFHIEHRLYSASELNDLIKDCGFAQTTVYGGFSGRPYDERASDLIVVAAK